MHFIPAFRPPTRGDHEGRLIKVAGLTVSTKAQTACHYGRADITDNRAASCAEFKADVTTAPRFHAPRTLFFRCPALSLSLAACRRQVMNITIITGA